MSYFETAIQRQIDEDRAYREAHGFTVLARPDGAPTIGDLIRAVLDVSNAEDARQFFDGYVAWMQALPDEDRPENPKSVARSNIGWCFDEGMSAERRAMWVEVCDAAHPVFGTTSPTPEEAFAAGLAHGETRRQSAE